MVPFLLFCLLPGVLADVRSRNLLNSPANSLSSLDSMDGHQPTFAFVIAILFLMFSITLLLLLYAKLCHRASGVSSRIHRSYQFDDGFLRSWRRSSGVDKKVVELLPFFRFETLKGAKEGLECPVCLGKYEDVEILRLLPKCKHAFHIDCIDSWLEKHSTCPLCRRRVTAEDILVSPSSRSLRIHSGDSTMNLRREKIREWSSRLGIGNLMEVAPQCIAVDPGEGGGAENLRNNHETVAMETPINGRWSSMSSPDLILLSSEMITDVSRSRIPASARVENGYGESITVIKEEIEKRALERKFSEINHPPPFHNSTTVGDSSDSTIDQRSLSDISLYSRNGRRTSAGGGCGGGRIRWPHIEITPVAEMLRRSSTAEEPNRRAVNV